MNMFEKIAKILIPVFLLGVFGSCNNESSTNNDEHVSSDLVTNPMTASGKEKKNQLPVMEFQSDKHDFGLIIQGEKVAHTFKFKNTGGSDLVISNCSATCGCTIPSWPKEPIKPGEEGKIEVVFSSAGRSGPNHKKIAVLTNAQPNRVELSISAEVFVPEKK